MATKQPERKCTEGEILSALALKYNPSEHIFAEKVKLGSSGSKIIDGVAIKKTWTPITIIGFEIKVSRSDFSRDTKHTIYMDNCTHFYFVAPEGIIDIDEIPKEAGLMIYNPKSKTLRIKKIAANMRNPVSGEMLLHIMFWKLERYNRPPTKLERLEKIKADIEAKNYGHKVANAMIELNQYRNAGISVNSISRATTQWDNLQHHLRDRYGRNLPLYSILDLLPKDENERMDFKLMKELQSIVRGIHNTTSSTLRMIELSEEYKKNLEPDDVKPEGENSE